jgi:N-acetylglucosamine-6-phosphate deacetylase
MRTRRLGVAAALVDGHLHEGDVAVAGERIAEIGLSPAGRGIAAPGFVDLQVNGFAGIDFLTATDDDAWLAASRRLLELGVTAYQPTLITAPREALRSGLRRAARLMRAQAHEPRAQLGARILGVHLEGPFLSPSRASQTAAQRLARRGDQRRLIRGHPELEQPP